MAWFDLTHLCCCWTHATWALGCFPAALPDPSCPCWFLAYRGQSLLCLFWMSLHSSIYAGSLLPVYGLSHLGFSTPALDLVNSGLPPLLRTYVCLELLLPLFGMCCLGPLMLSPDSMHVDLPLSLQSSVQLGLSLLVFGLTRLGLTLLSLDLASLGPGLFLQTLACLGLTPLVYGLT